MPSKPRKGRKPVIYRKAILSDAEDIFEINNAYAAQGLMLTRSRYQVYETIRDFTVAEEDGRVVGFAALHVMGEDLAEVRTTAIAPEYQRRGIGRSLVDALLLEGRQLGVQKAFTLTYQPEFFSACGFVLEDKNNMPRKVWTDCINCTKFPNCDEICMSRPI